MADQKDEMDAKQGAMPLDGDMAMPADEQTTDAQGFRERLGDDATGMPDGDELAEAPIDSDLDYDTTEEMNDI